MQKIVSNGERMTTVSLDGSECEVVFGSRYNVFSVAADSDVTVALESGRTAEDDGVMVCKGGESIMYPHMMRLDRLYITGAGKVSVFASNAAINPFKQRAKGGGENGWGTVTRGVAEYFGRSNNYDYVGAAEETEGIL